MKHVLLVLLIACGASSNAPAESAPPSSRATARSDSPPAATTPPTRTDAPPPTLPPVNCAAQDEAAEYCAHVHDRCCGSDFQGWVCDNARYVDWFAAQCPRH